jgi:hypothetical protein
VELSGSRCKSLETGLRPDLSGTTTEQVQWGSLEAGIGLWKLATNWTSLVEEPDKSGTRLWKPVDSLDLSGETWNSDIWMVKHLDLSPNFFDVSLLIV